MIRTKNRIKEKLASHVKSAHNIDMSTLVIGYSKLIHHLFNPATGESYTMTELAAQFGIDRTTINHLSGRRGILTFSEFFYLLYIILYFEKPENRLPKIVSILNDIFKVLQEESGIILFPEGFRADFFKQWSQDIAKDTVKT